MRLSTVCGNNRRRATVRMTWVSLVGVIVVVGSTRKPNQPVSPSRALCGQLFTGLCGADYKATGFFLVIDIQIVTTPLSFE